MPIKRYGDYSRANVKTPDQPAGCGLLRMGLFLTRAPDSIGYAYENGKATQATVARWLSPYPGRFSRSLKSLFLIFLIPVFLHVAILTFLLVA